MANDNGHGGYRAPSSPAPVSGPGALSARTDGGPAKMPLDPGNVKYGEAQQFNQIQGGAPLAPQPGSGLGSTPPAAPAQPPTPLTAPTGNPQEPVTAGADAGPGPGSSVLGLPDTSNEVADLKQRYGPYLPLLIRKADDPSSSPEFRAQVRYVLSKIG